MNGWHQVFEMIRFGKRELNHICSISSESKYPEKNLKRMRALIYICNTREENEGKYSRTKRKSGKEYNYIFLILPLSALNYKNMESYDTKHLIIVFIYEIIENNLV